MRFLRSRKTRASLVAGLAVAMPLALIASPAQAAHVVCGQTITANTVLDAPLGPCLGNGIIIRADNITLDLGGFTVSGVGLSQGVGVYLGAHSGVTITNGSIRQFHTGVAIVSGASNTVSDLIVVDNTGGEGILIDGHTSDNNKILNNYVARNGPLDGIGVAGGLPDDKLTGTEISGNVVLDNAASDRTGGIHLENWTWNTTVSNNTVKGSAKEGIATFADTRYNTITGNRVDHNGFNNTTDYNSRPGDGIRAEPSSSNHTISGNTVTNNGGNGIFVNGPSGGFIPGSTDNSITNNTATGNNAKPTILVKRPPIYLEGRLSVTATVTANNQTTTATLPIVAPAYDLHDGNPNCDNNTWSANVYGTRNPPSCVS